jgi:hypothetical protein
LTPPSSGLGLNGIFYEHTATPSLCALDISSPSWPLSVEMGAFIFHLLWWMINSFEAAHRSI